MDYTIADIIFIMSRPNSIKVQQCAAELKAYLTGQIVRMEELIKIGYVDTAVDTDMLRQFIAKLTFLRNKLDTEFRFKQMNTPDEFERYPIGPAEYRGIIKTFNASLDKMDWLDMATSIAQEMKLIMKVKTSDNADGTEIMNRIATMLKELSDANPRIFNNLAEGCGLKFEFEEELIVNEEN